MEQPKIGEYIPHSVSANIVGFIRCLKWKELSEQKAAKIQASYRKPLLRDESTEDLNDADQLA